MHSPCFLNGAARVCHFRTRGCRARANPASAPSLAGRAFTGGCDTPEQLAFAVSGFFARPTRARMTNTERIAPVAYRTVSSNRHAVS